MKNIAIIGAVVVIVAVLFGTGILSVSKVQGWVRHAFFRSRGEVQRAISERPVGSVENAEKCRANLRLLESAKRKVGAQMGIASGAVTWADVLKAADLRQKPVCPDGGEYHLKELGHVVTCSIGGNNTVDKADDHVIYGF